MPINVFSSGRVNAETSYISRANAKAGHENARTARKNARARKQL
jgi:hypothetical protein